MVSPKRTLPKIEDQSMGEEYEDGEELDAEAGRALRLHRTLVAYVSALDPLQKVSGPVSKEHSYSLARRWCGSGDPRSCHGEAPAVLEQRGLYVRRPPRCRACRDPSPELDVERLSPEPPPLEGDDHNLADATDDEDNDWEESVLATAPSAQYRALAESTVQVLQATRLATLAGARGCVRAGARRWRRSLALSGKMAPAWLHSKMLSRLPPAQRRLYDALVAEVHRRSPVLCARLRGAGPLPALDPLAAPVLPPTPRRRRPLLLWLPSGMDRLDERWERRFRILIPVQRVHIPQMEACSVERWCAGVVERARMAVRGAGGRRVVVGGAGAGALLALQLAGEAGLAALALGPALHTAEGGARLSPAPRAALVLAGEGGSRCSWAAAHAAAPPGARLLLVGGADDALCLPPRLARRLPQHALDAAIAEECVQWMCEALADKAAPGVGELPPLVEEEPPVRRLRTALRRVSSCSDDEYVHLPAPAVAPILRSSQPRNEPSNAGCAGHVVRGTGAVPLQLPRRKAPPVPDIMRMPIVFADDEPDLTDRQAPAPEKRTIKFSKIIVAKRGGGGAGRGGVVMRIPTSREDAE